MRRLRVGGPALVTALFLAGATLRCSAGDPPVDFGTSLPPGGGATLCDRACNRIYRSCSLALATASGSLSLSQCMAQCQAGALDGYEACLSEVPCSRGAVIACFESVPIRQFGDDPGRGDGGAPPSDASFPDIEILGDDVPATQDAAPSGDAPPAQDAAPPPPPPPPPPPTATCTTACRHIYGDCMARLNTSSGVLSESQCASYCEGNTSYRNNVACLTTMTCSSSAFAACLAGAAPMPPPSSDPCAASTTCEACTAQASCGWCNGACYSGSASGPLTGSCGTSSWAWVASECSGAPPPPPPPPPTPPPPPPPPGTCGTLSAPFGRAEGQTLPDVTGIRCTDSSSYNYRNQSWCGARLTIVATGSFT